MSAKRKIGLAGAALALVAPGLVALRVLARAEDRPLVPNTVVREIDDPSSGDCWLLERDPSHPGGPGRLVLARRESSLPESGEKPVIRAGERVIVEENSPVAVARLEAVALSNGWRGSALKVRIEIGGRIARAIAIAPGRAALEEEGGARR